MKRYDRISERIIGVEHPKSCSTKGCFANSPFRPDIQAGQEKFLAGIDPLLNAQQQAKVRIFQALTDQRIRQMIDRVRPECWRQPAGPSAPTLKKIAVAAAIDSLDRCFDQRDARSVVVRFRQLMDLHKLAAERSLAFHRIIAARLAADPAILEKAGARVKTWLERTPASPFARGWEKVLANDAESIAGFLVERSERAEELRQSSPFAGALDPRERWRIWRDTRQKFAGER